MSQLSAIESDITTLLVDAIVNAVNENLNYLQTGMAVTFCCFAAGDLDTYRRLL